MDGRYAPQMTDSWDVFVCHATEDKAIVRPLAEALQRSGLSVWYDDFTLKLGESLREALDRGLRNSSFGVVVLSPAFFSKQWPQWELNALVTRQLSDRRNIIIPIWHNITGDEVRAQSPSLADLIAANTASGLTAVAEQVLDAVRRVALTESASASATAPAPVPARRSLRSRISSRPSPAISEPSLPVTPWRSLGVPWAVSTGPSTSRVTGVVKWWSDDKGFGFLTPDGGGPDVFAHYIHLADAGALALSEGDRVEFAIEKGEKGPIAANVVMVSPATGQQDAPYDSAANDAGRRVGREAGVVKWWSDEKGFGFLTPDDGGRDVFVHHSRLLGDQRVLSEGDRVEFIIEKGEKGPIATNVR